MRLIGVKFHIVGLVVYLVFSAVLSALNHTQLDVVVTLPTLPFSMLPSSIFGIGTNKKIEHKVTRINLFDYKYHDVHHHIPMTNFGQYMVLWDKLFVIFRDYNEDTPVNPDMQLDPLTGRTKCKV